MKGLVIKSTGNNYIVHFANGTETECFIKGNFRIRGIRSTNPIAIGDFVEVQTLTDGTSWITDVYDRRNYIIRRATNLSKESHILAANIDQAILLVTINHPATSTTFIDRFLATCEAYQVPAILLFNKLDLLNEAEKDTLHHLQSLYSSLHYPTYIISAKQMTIEQTHYIQQTLLSGKTTLLSGNSGVGKSTLLNAIFGHELTRTGAISDVHNKGTHTTTFSEMYPLPGAQGGWIIDTPGIKGFGTIHMQKEEIGHYFREIFLISAECRYSNCTHTEEPGCAVCKAVEQGQIALSRFESYLSLLNDGNENKYR